MPSNVTPEMIEAAAKAIADSIGHGMREKCYEHARAALSAALSVEAVKVKPLEWGNAALRHGYGLIIRIAQTRFGAYQILKGSQGRFEVYFGSVPFSGAMDDIDAAIAWAQSDYSARVLSALEPAPVASEPVAEQWCAYDGGEQRTSWSPVGFGDRSGWEKLAERYPDRYQVITRPLYAHPSSGPAVDGWQPIETAPKDGTTILAWHTVHMCPVAITWKDKGYMFHGEVLNWYERTYTTAWPERCFSHWRPLLASPTPEGVQAQ